MRSVVRKGTCALFIALFLCVALATPSFAGEVHWYNWFFSEMQQPDACNQILWGDFLQKSDSEIKEDIYDIADMVFGFPILEGIFECRANLFSLPAKDLLMARSIRKLGKWAEAMGKTEVAENFFDIALQLESQYFGILAVCNRRFFFF